MNKATIKHIPKSSMAYAIDKDHLHIYLQTAKNDITQVELIIGDPFDYKNVDGIHRWEARTRPFIMMEKSYSNELLDYWFCEVKTFNKRSKYAFIIHRGNNKYFYGCRTLQKVNLKVDEKIIYNLSDYYNFPYINEEDLINSPSWSKETIWYQIFPERFHRSSKSTSQNFLPWGSIEEGIRNHHFFGGNIQGIIEKIPYLQELGITGIYFTPIFEATSAHKYDTIDYFKIDPSFGTNQDFKELVEKCHQAGIKVMLDAVFNHCGWFHPFWQDVIKNKKSSPYWDCFFIDDEDFIDFEINEKGLPQLGQNMRYKFKTFAFTPMMPKLNTNNSFMEDYLLQVASYWVKEYDIDGWRLDVSNEVSHSFWRKFRQTVRSIKPDIYILGENWDDSNPWLRGDQFDAVMNYEIAYPLWQFLGTDGSTVKIDSVKFSYLINDLLVKYPKSVAINMFNLVDSHDTMRMITRCNNSKDLLKLAYLFIFSFCGSPAIYYGDEIGLTGKHDPDCRRCMIWDENKQDKELFDFFKALIKIRKSNPDFNLVDLKWLKNDDNIIIYQKGNLIFALNNNQIEKKVSINGNFIDLIDNNGYQEEIILKPYGFRILEKKRS